MLTPEGQSRLDKLAPFARRARCYENGREKLHQHRKKLAFILVTEDLAKNSLDEVLRTFSCPVYQALTAEEIRQRFDMENTKILGFRKTPLALQMEQCFAGCRINPETETEAKTEPAADAGDAPQHPETADK